MLPRYRFRKPLTPLARGLHPIVRRLFLEMLKQHLTIWHLAEKTGINRTTIQGWRAGKSPKMADVDDCFQVLGMRLTVVEVGE